MESTTASNPGPIPPNDLPLILGDRIQLQQVILNLIINAIEVMSGVNEGPRELLVGSGKDESQRVLVAVRDSGPGLDPESVNDIFAAFYTPNLKAWAWDWRLVARLSRRTAGGSGRQRIPTKVRRFSSCRSVAGISMIEALTN